MNNILGKKIELKKGYWALLSLYSVCQGCYLRHPLLAFFFNYHWIYSIYTCFGKKIRKNVLETCRSCQKYSQIFFINVVISAAVSVFLQQILKWGLTGNPINEAFSPLLFIILPIMILGEELFSVYFLAIFLVSSAFLSLVSCQQSSLDLSITVLMIMEIFYTLQHTSF